MAQGILNPVKFRSLLPLLPAEREFARCLANGEPCSFLKDLNAPVAPEAGSPENTIRAEVIRFFAYGGDEKKSVRGKVVALLGAWICGEKPLDLSHADTPYALTFSCCHFAVAVNMQHAKCEALYLNGSRLTRGLTADGLKTKGNVHLRASFSAQGEVRLLGADIGGDLDCAGGEFHNLGGEALNADGLKTRGTVFLAGGFSAEGEVRLLGADIGGPLACGGGKFHNPNGFALIAERARLGGGLLWRGIKEGKGVVNLAYAKAGVLTDDLDSWKSFKVVLDGFAYDQFSGSTDADLRLKWLANRPSKLPGGIPLPFSPLPYEQAAKVLFGMGHARDAREVLLEKERLQTKDSRTPWHHKIGRRLWNVFAGYGYRLRYTAYWAAGFVFLGAFLFHCADENGRMVPHQPVVLANAEYKSEMARATGNGGQCRDGPKPTEAVARLFPDYPGFNAAVYSLDVFIPFFALHQEPYWYPKPREMDGWFLRWGLPVWYWLEIGAGWILTSLFLLSVTGVLRPRQSSGEKG